MTISASDRKENGPIRLGMVGGGSGAFIGAVHRIAARLDGEYALVAGALSSTPETARSSGAALGLAADRSYGSFAEMAEAEAARPDGIEAVSIVTPNHMHAPAARPFLERGIHVICDKPLTATMEDAQGLAQAARDSRSLFILTHNYTGYPMVRQAREMVAAGDLGRVSLVQAEYAQDWLTEAAETSGSNKQAEWRTDPERSGAGGSVGDIGTHAHNLACFVTGLAVERLSADLQSFVPGRRLDDNGHVLLRFAGGARGMLWCSQVAPGNENGLRLRVYGEKGSLEWHQEDPNRLSVKWLDGPEEIRHASGGYLSEDARAVTRLPGGHPEGYLEAFGVLYREFADALNAAQDKHKASLPSTLPGIEAGVRGMRFIDRAVESSKKQSWVDF